MFLSVVILGRFTTETHAMALYVSIDTPPLLTPHPGTQPGHIPAGSVTVRDKPDNYWAPCTTTQHRPGRGFKLRVRVVACTAVDDPPPKQDDGPARGAVRAFGRRSDDGLQRTPLVLWRHRSSRRRLSMPNYPLRCAQGGQVFRRAASTPRRSAEPWRRRRQILFAGQSPLALVLTFSALVEQLGRPDGSTARRRAHTHHTGHLPILTGPR